MASDTKLYRIKSIKHVELDLARPRLSKWECDAAPVSEITGLDIKSTAGDEFVVLRGYIWID